MRRTTFLAICALLPALPLVCQTTGGRIMGTILDRSGAAVPAAKLSARNIETGIERGAESNGEGNYVLYPLQPGVYRVTVQAPGFRAEQVDQIRVDVSAVLTRNFRLEVGALEQVVAVSAETAPMLVQTASVESTIIREQIESLPLNGRDFNTLVLLAAGAVENINSGNGKDFGSVAANGNRAFSNDYLLDGTPNNDVFQGRSGAAVSVDVIREFKVTSGVAPAEFGQAGTQVTVATRGGTNKIHGSAFEYHRGNTWQARDPFNTEAQQPFHREQFGGSIGGPLRRDRTFFFFNYEGNRQAETATRVATVPRDEFWKGDFSSLLDRKIQLRDPLDPARPVIPNNRLDQYLGGARISKTALKLRPFWGSPNKPGLANNLVQFADDTSNANQFTARVDHMLPRNQSLAGRYTQAKTTGKTPSILGNGTGLYAPTDNYNTSATWTVPASARTVSELRFGYAKFSQLTTYEDGGLPTTESLGLKGFDKYNPTLPPMPRITFTGTDAFTQLNYGGNENYGMAALIKVSKTYNLSETLTHSRGRHTFKAGFDLRRIVLPALQQSNASGQITFRSSTTGASSGYTFADLLMGLPGSSQEVPVKAPIVLKQTEFSSYIQDDWRVAPRLTLTFGLRHELFLNPYEEKNRLALFDMSRGAIVVASDDGKLPTGQFLPAVVAKLTDGKGNWRFPLLSDKEAGWNLRRLLKTQYKHFGPRFGFVYQARANTIVRGGYGVFYTRYPIQYLQQTVAVNPPFAGLFTHSQSLVNGVPLLTLDAPYAAAGSASVSPVGMQQDLTLPNNQQWNLTVERDLGWGTAISLGYVGNKGTHLYRSTNANASYIDRTTGAVARKYSGTFGTSSISVRLTNGNSIYHAMQTEIRRRTRKGLLFQANWTWAKGIDDVGTTVQAAQLDVENLGRDRADSDYVRRHVLKFNATYDLPFGRRKALLGSAPAWLNTMVGGWRLSGIWQYTTGMRFTPQFSSAGGLSNNRPDVIYGAQANLPRGERNRDRWFNPKAFAEVPAVDPATGSPRFGNAGRNILIGPGLNVADASLAKSWPVGGESRRITVRLEAFNAFNHPNFDFPQNNISNVNTVGTITRVVKPMRQAQFAFRFDF
ncbi:MAG: TonB-dependent receptor [Acidobacteria bacterium]|nr:TonB-dependent receptor [Acidobacteriota bacterium]